MAGQVIGRRGQGEDLLIVGRLAQEKVEKFRSFEPPVAEQLGVERTDQDRFDRHFRAQGCELPDALGQKSAACASAAASAHGR